MPERSDQRTVDGVEDDDFGGDVGGLDDDLDGGLDDDVDVEVGADPAAKYDHLVEGGSGSAGPSGDPDASSDADDGGLLSGLFGSDQEGQSQLETTASTGDDGGFLADRIGGSISLKAFALVFLGTAALVGVAATFIPIVGVPLGVPLGLFVAAFLGGLVSSKRRYAEFTITGVIIGVVAILFGINVAIFDGFSVPPAAIGGGVGVLLGFLTTVLGHYFGRDLRAGLTKDV